MKTDINQKNKMEESIMKTCHSEKTFFDTVNIELFEKPKIEASELFEHVNKTVRGFDFVDYICKSCGESYGLHQKGKYCCERTKQFYARYDNCESINKMHQEMKDKINYLVSEENGFHKKHLKYILENYRHNKQKQIILNYLDDFHKNLADGIGVLMYGFPGSGKTHLVTACILEAIKNHYSLINTVCIGSFIEIMMRIKNKFKDQYGIIQDLLNCDLLVIDDIGKGNITEFSKEIIYCVINGRYEREKTTFFTTNCSTKELSEMIDSATVSRLTERNIMIDFRDIKDNRPKIGKVLTRKYTEGL